MLLSDIFISNLLFPVYKPFCPFYVCQLLSRVLPVQRQCVQVHVLPIYLPVTSRALVSAFPVFEPLFLWTCLFLLLLFLHYFICQFFFMSLPLLVGPIHCFIPCSICNSDFSFSSIKPELGDCTARGSCLFCFFQRP